jgi:1-acyl-sn-glycerol-3-phosphate acyltransferase
MRSALVLLTLLVVSPALAAVVAVARLLGVRDRPGSVWWWVPHAWARSALWAAGVRVRVHGAEGLGDGRSGVIYLGNHVSWFDVFTLAAVLPRAGFVSKAEILRIPVFGAGAKLLGSIPIERTNRKAAFGTYDEAARRVRAGQSVVVFPEGTRGRTYAIRAFKKGPFVLAIAAGAPIIPVLIHGTLPIMPKGTWRIRSGDVDVHVLEAIPTAGLTYADRNVLVARVRERLAEALEALYGIASEGAPAEGPPPGLPLLTVSPAPHA